MTHYAITYPSTTPAHINRANAMRDLIAYLGPDRVSVVMPPLIQNIAWSLIHHDRDRLHETHQAIRFFCAMAGVSGYPARQLPNVLLACARAHLAA